METAKKEAAASTRIIFLDNLRSLFVLGVVVFHSSLAYIGQYSVKWWPVSEGDSSLSLAFLQAFLDAFTMPLLFYIAGYFALPAIRNHGTVSFIKGKLKRLGIPWVVCILTICPILPLIYHYTRDNMTLSGTYLDLWITLMKNAAQFNIGVFSMAPLMMNDGFYQRYMWFVSLLLAFFLIFSIIYKAKRKWFDTSRPVSIESPSVSLTLKMLGIVGLLSFIATTASFLILFAFNKNVNPSAWFTLGNIIQFPVVRLVLFIIYFGMGVVTCRNKWIERGRSPGHLKTWTVSFFVLLIAYLIVMYGIMSGPNKNAYGLFYLPVQSFLTVSILGLFSSLAIRYWNKPRRIDQSLASASYDIYLSHYPFVFAFQLVLFTAPGIPPLLKFTIVSALSIVCAYLVSRFLIRPFPKATVALLFTMLLVMFAVVKP